MYDNVVISQNFLIHQMKQKNKQKTHIFQSFLNYS